MSSIDCLKTKKIFRKWKRELQRRALSHIKPAYQKKPVATMGESIMNEVRSSFQVTNLYDVLRIPKDSDQSIIKRAYLQRSLELHPDKTTDPEQKDSLKVKFQTLSQVYDLLRCPERRADYDRQMFLHELRSNQADSTNFHDHIKLIDCDEMDNFYHYHCRCSGRFVIPKEILNTKMPNILIVDCDSCSNSIKISH